MATKKSAPKTPKLPTGIIQADVDKSVVTIQQVNPTAPGKDKLRAALTLIALFSGIVGASIPNSKVKAVSDVVSATVAALQANGKIVKDR